MLTKTEAEQRKLKWRFETHVIPNIWPSLTHSEILFIRAYRYDTYLTLIKYLCQLYKQCNIL